MEWGSVERGLVLCRILGSQALVTVDCTALHVLC